jgi:hypothetical protein
MVLKSGIGLALLCLIFPTSLSLKNPHADHGPWRQGVVVNKSSNYVRVAANCTHEFGYQILKDPEMYHLNLCHNKVPPFLSSEGFWAGEDMDFVNANGVWQKIAPFWGQGYCIVVSADETLSPCKVQPFPWGFLEKMFLFFKA